MVIICKDNRTIIIQRVTKKIRIVSKMVYSINLDDATLKIFEKMGINFEQIMKAAKIPHRAFGNGKLSLTDQQYMDMNQAFNDHIPIESVLLMSDVANMVVFIPPFFAGLCAENGLNCLRRVTKYKRLIGPFNMEMSEGEHDVKITCKYKHGEALPRFSLVSEQITLMSLVRKGSGRSDISPVSIKAPYAYPKDVATYFGSSIEKSIVNEIIFKKSDLMIPFITENNNMWDYLEPELNKRIEELETDDSFAASVRKVLFEIIPGGASDLEKVATELNVSVRTLQRKLKEEKTTFAEQLNHTRELLVRHYLKSDMCLDEIAFLVNYSDAKSLSRAFKIWSGMSVTEYKRQYA